MKTCRPVGARTLCFVLFWAISSFGRCESEPESDPPADQPGAVDVYLGIYVINVNDIELATNIYTADFYIWFKWKGDIDPSQTFEFINELERWGSTREAVHEEPIVLPDGFKYQQLRIQAKFNEKFPLNAYPLDWQNLVIQVEDTHSSEDFLRYHIDQGDSGVDPELQLPGWIIDRHEIKVIEKSYPTRFGLPNSMQSRAAYSRAEYRLYLSRPFWSSTFKMILPVLIVLLSTFCVFWLPPEQIDSRVGLAITALLSAVALHITAISNLPPVSYLVLIDKIYNLAYGVVFLTLVSIIASVRLVESDNSSRAVRLDIFCARVLPIVFLLGSCLLIAFR